MIRGLSSQNKNLLPNHVFENYATNGWFKKGIFAFLDASWSNPKSQDECLIYQP